MKPEARGYLQDNGASDEIVYLQQADEAHKQWDMVFLSPISRPCEVVVLRQSSSRLSVV